MTEPSRKPFMSRRCHRRRQQQWCATAWTMWAKAAGSGTGKQPKDWFVLLPDAGFHAGTFDAAAAGSESSSSCCLGRSVRLREGYLSLSLVCADSKL